jgi:hypothetical protein
MKSALFALAALLSVTIGTAALSPASAVVSTAPYSDNSGGGAG